MNNSTQKLRYRDIKCGNQDEYLKNTSNTLIKNWDFYIYI